MKKFEIQANFIGLLFTEVKATTAEEAKEKFLTSLGTTLNGFGEPSVTIENVTLPSVKSLVLTELNMVFPDKLTNDDKKHWEGIEIEEVENFNNNITKKEELKEADILLKFLSNWGARNGFKFLLPKDGEKNIDFININFKTNTIFVDELNIEKDIIDIQDEK